MFPVEIVCAVLESADWRSLLRAKLVCTTWYCATKSRQMWYTFVKELTTDNTMTKIEGRVDDYTEEELERWVITKLRAREAWFSKNSSLLKVRVRTFHYRHIGTSISYYPEFQLLPGGRWALVCVPGKGIIYYDLDSDSLDVKERVLVGPATMDFLDQKCVPCVQMWVDQNNPSLALRMVVKENKNEVRPEFQLAHVFQIDVVGHGKNSYLKARLLTTIKHNKTQYHSWYVSSTDQILAELWETRPKGIELRITRWNGDHLRDVQKEGKRVKLSTSKVVQAPRCIAYKEFILLLSQDAPHDIYTEIYSIPKIENHDTRDGPIQPLYRLPLNRNRMPLPYHYMQPFSYQGLDWVTIGHGFEFSINQLSNNGSPTRTPSAAIPLQDKLVTSSIPCCSCTRIEPAATVILHRSSPEVLVAIKTYGWSQRNGDMDFHKIHNMHLRFDPSEFNIKYTHEFWGYLSGVDTGSGRILVSSGDGLCIVLDTVAASGGLGELGVPVECIP